MRRQNLKNEKTKYIEKKSKNFSSSSLYYFSIFNTTFINIHKNLEKKFKNNNYQQHHHHVITTSPPSTAMHILIINITLKFNIHNIIKEAQFNQSHRILILEVKFELLIKAKKKHQSRMSNTKN